MVIERINGKSLDEVEPEIIEEYIDEIYRLYNILADKGFILNDLYDRNIILSDDKKIYFIDFDPLLTNDTLHSVPISQRLSKEKLLYRLTGKISRKSTNRRSSTSRKSHQKIGGTKKRLFKKRRRFK